MASHPHILFFARLRSALLFLGNPLVELIAAQLLFVIVGITFLDFNVSWLEAALTVGTAIISELTFANSESLRRNGKLVLFMPNSAIAAALGIVIFFRAVHPAYFVLAAFVAIASKYLIKISGKHIFNPSNAAIVSLVFLFPFATTIEFTQWGSSLFIYILVAAIAGTIAVRAKAYVTTISFLFSYVIFLVALVSMGFETVAMHHYGLLGPSFVLFASFMITDPRTSPQGLFPRIIHGISVALLFFSLNIIGVRYDLFLATFLIALANGISRAPVWSNMPFRHPWQHIPNMPTFIIVLAFFSYACIGNAPNAASSFPWYRISPSFILFGIESGGIRACSDTPALSPQESSGLTQDLSVHGIAWGDYSSDGYDDVFVSSLSGPSRLYRNSGQGTFVDVTEQVGLPLLLSASGYFADYDNDGYVDLFVTYMTPATSAGRPSPLVRVFRNTEGKRFIEVTNAVGLSGIHSLPNESYGLNFISFADYDSDGRLDILLSLAGNTISIPTGGNTVAMMKSFFDPAIPRTAWSICGIHNISDALAKLPILRSRVLDIERSLVPGVCMQVVTRLGTYGLPPHSGSPDYGDAFSIALSYPSHLYLFENTGSAFHEVPGFGRMMQTLMENEKVTGPGIKRTRSEYTTNIYFQPLSFDYDEDGKTDVYLSADFGNGRLLRNTGNFNFRDVTSAVGLNSAGSKLGTDVADYDNDGTLDIAGAGTFHDYAYKNNGDGTFSDMTNDLELGRMAMGFGLTFLDYDLDGRPDLYTMNGAPTNGAPAGGSRDYTRAVTRALFRTNRLYRNIGDGRFQESTWEDMCPGVQEGKTAAVSDYNNDGTSDVLVGNSYYPGLPGSGLVLYNNRTSSDNGYLKIRLKGVRDNSQGIGAIVTVSYPGFTEAQTVTAGSGFASQNSSALIFGLGQNSGPVDIRVRWPSATETVIHDVPLNREITIDQSR